MTRKSNQIREALPVPKAGRLRAAQSREAPPPLPRTVDRERQKRASKRGVAARREKTEDRRAAEATLAAEFQAVLHRIYPDGLIPPREGGLFFREAADHFGVEERQLQAIAAKAGAWPWRPCQVERAFREATDGAPDAWRSWPNSSSG
jgi:hypothetical protein